MLEESDQRDRPLVLLLDQDQVLWQPANGPAGLSGGDLVEVREPAEVFQCFREMAPDFVILGATGPETDRFAVCAALHHPPEGLRTNLLVMTAAGDVPAMERAFEAGADGFIPIPVDWKTLDQLIRFLWRQSRSRRALQRREARLSRYLEALPDSLVRLGPGGRILDVHGPRDSEVAGFLRSSMGRKIAELVSPDEAHSDARAFRSALQRGSKKRIGHLLHLGARSVACETTLVPAGSGEMIAIVRDVSDQRRHAEPIPQAGAKDHLMCIQGLPAFRELLSGSLAQALRDESALALLLVDFSRFNRVNETFGTGGGDLVLRTIAARIAHCTRRGDRRSGFRREEIPPSLARIGGDQFAVLLEHLRQKRDSSKVARRILDAMSHPFTVSDTEVFLTASIGIAVFPGDGDAADTLLLNAHSAMLDARQRGGSTFGFFDPSENAKALRERSIVSSLGKALDAGELFLVHQPRVDLQTGCIIGVQAFPHWEHPEWGDIPAPELIPIAEQAGLSVPIGQWVIESACLQSQIWQKAGLPPIPMVVNLTVRQFRAKDLVEIIRRSLARSALDPSLLEIEIAEATAMDKADVTLRILNDLKEIGVRLAIGEFGTGHLSLRHLGNFPFDGLRIDRAFVSDVHARPESQTIVKAVLAMARSFKLSVIAEGVEKHEELSFLKENGCGAIQGDYFSPPLPALDMTRLLHQAQRLVC